MSNSIRVTKKSGLFCSVDVVEMEGLSDDVDNLPTNVATGSTFFAIDTKKVYKFEETTQTWYEL